MKLLYLLLLSIFFNACNGQGQPQVHEAAGETATGTTKLVKTQGTGKHANVHCGLMDRNGYLWFGTSGEGVYRYDGKSFTNFTEKDGLRNNNVFAVAEDQAGNIWFGTGTGLSRYDGKTFTTVALDKGGGTYSLGGTGIPVWSILCDKNGALWCGTDKDGVYRYDGNSFTHFLHNDGIENKDSLRLNAVNSIVEDKDGNIWFATWFEGICRYDRKSITSFKPNGEVWFATILEDKKGGIWAGRRNHGVCRYDGSSFTNVPQNGIFDSCSVRPLAEDKRGNIWFGTEFSDITRREMLGGLWCYDGKSFKNFTMADGLPDNSVWTVVEDRDANIWVGTRNTGLCRYDGKTFTRFSE